MSAAKGWRPSASGSASTERVWLDVPYREKDAAKALGARWDPAAKRWFTSPRRAPALQRWAALPDIPDLLDGEDRSFGDGLFVDLVPESCWFTNVRTCVDDRDWERLRRMITTRADGRCEACGRHEDRQSRRWLEAHERWAYAATIQRRAIDDRDCHNRQLPTTRATGRVSLTAAGEPQVTSERNRASGPVAPRPENRTRRRTAVDVSPLRMIRVHIEPGGQGTADDRVSRTVMTLANGVVMTAEQLRTAGIVLGVLTAILFVLGQSQLGVVAAILAGGAYTLASRRPSGREDDKP